MNQVVKNKNFDYDTISDLLFLEDFTFYDANYTQFHYIHVKPIHIQGSNDGP